MKLSLKIRTTIFILFSLLTINIFAGKPLRTDDASTVGLSSLELEITSEFSFDDETRELSLPVGITFGLLDNLDLSISTSGRHGIDGHKENTRGFDDLAIEFKYVLENSFIDIGLKPIFTLPTGDYSAGFGKGKPTYGLYFLFTKEFGNLYIHSQAGYLQNNNIIDEDPNHWELSIAAEYNLDEKFTLVLESGTARDCDPISEYHPVYLLSGLAYTISEKVIFDLGVLKGLNKSEIDFGLMTGFTIGF